MDSGRTPPPTLPPAAPAVADAGRAQTADDAPVAPDAPHLTVAAVARRLGVAPATLRTWARRYALGPSEHAAGAHRRYSLTDVARLETMRRLTLEGVPPGEAARFALAASPALLLADAPVPDRDGSTVRPPDVPDSGPALPAEAVARGLSRAAMALDSSAVLSIIRAQLAQRGVVGTWEDVLCPVLATAGARWAATGEGIEVEHLLSDGIATALREFAAGALEPRGGRPVLLASAPDDQHGLPLHVLSAGLAERGVAARVLGAALPASSLEAAVRRTGPAALFVWSQLPRTTSPDVLHALPVLRPATAVIAGGPGWLPELLPPRATYAETLPHALALVEGALGV